MKAHCCSRLVILPLRLLTFLAFLGWSPAHDLWTFVSASIVLTRLSAYQQLATSADYGFEQFSRLDLLLRHRGVLSRACGVCSVVSFPWASLYRGAQGRRIRLSFRLCTCQSWFTLSGNLYPFFNSFNHVLS